MSPSSPSPEELLSTRYGLDAGLLGRAYGPRFLLDGAAAARQAGPALSSSITTLATAGAMDALSYM